jgi:hypothetical protein
MVVMPDKINDELSDVPENKPFDNDDDWFADLPDFEDEEPASIKRAEGVEETLASAELEEPEELETPVVSSRMQLPPVRLDEPEEESIEELPQETPAEPKPPLKERVAAFFASLKKNDKDKAEKAEKTTKSLAFPKKEKVETEKVKKEKEPKPVREKREPGPLLGRLGPIFWTVSGAIALLIALILLVATIVIASNAMRVTAQINEHLVGNLYDSFVAMDEASIKTTIPIQTEVPAKFDVLLDTMTTVNLSEDVYITSATVSLTTGGLSITNAPTNIILPEGTELPIHLVLTVPVDEMIPVEMLVDVDIPLAETELHDPFVKLQRTIQPYYMWLWSMTTPGVKAFDYPWKQ